MVRGRNWLGDFVFGPFCPLGCGASLRARRDPAGRGAELWHLHPRLPAGRLRNLPNSQTIWRGCHGRFRRTER